MSLKTDLTRADLDGLRLTVLGEANPLGVAAELADAAEAGKLADKQDAGAALTLAAEIAENRSKLDAALRYASRAVETYTDKDSDQAVTARAVHARILFQTGRGDDAMAEIEALRPALTLHNDAPAYISAALSVGGHNKLAEQWLTEAVRDAMAERSAEPADPDDAGLLFFLLQQRHRVRHALNLQHDANDNLAERLEARLTVNASGAATAAGDLLFWSRAEFDRLLGQWPALSEAYGKDWDDHRAHLEQELVRLTAAGRTGLTVLPASVDALVKSAGTDGDPAAAKTRADYARTLSASPARIAWPPERNGACWCGSGLKYKKCCLPRSRA